MTFEVTVIIVSLGGLFLTTTGLILTQFRASHRDLNEQLAGIRSDLRDATREIGKNRDRIAQVEVSLTEQIGQVEVSLRERIAQVEVSLTQRIARVEGNVEMLREYIVGKGREPV